MSNREFARHKKANDPNFVFYFVFNNEDKVSDVIVWRWYLDIAKEFISTYKKPDNKIILKSGLGVGSTVAELEKVYGRWEMDEVGFWEIGWPITVSFCSKDDQCNLTVGIELGDMTREEYHELLKDHSHLHRLRAGIILFAK